MIDSSAISRVNRSPHGSSALAFRHWVLVLAPLLAGVLAIGGAIADPAVDLDGEAMCPIHAEQPGPLQWKPR